MIHKFTGSTASLVGTPTLPVRLECNNAAANGALNTLVCRVASISRLGQISTDPQKAYISGVTTLGVLKRGAGKLHRLIINTSSNTTSYTLYDAVSAATSVFASGIFNAQGNPYSIEFQVPFYNGLTITTAGATSNLTVIYE